MGVILNPYISFGSINYTELEWSPADLGANVVRGMWAPYAYPNTVLESSGNVLKIDDVSGNGYHMAVGTNAPNWNSLTKEVEFDYLNTEWMYADMDASTQDVGTLFWVADFGTGSTFGRWFGGPGNDANSTGVTGWAIRSGDSIFRTYYQNTIPLNTPVPSGYFLGSVTVSSTGFESRLNSVSSQTASVTTPTASFTQLKIGQGFNDNYCASLNFRAAIFVQGDLTTDERQRIEGWLAYKCQIQSELPVDHPYRYYIFTDASTILWNPTDLSPTSLRGLWNPYGDVSSVTLSTNDVTAIADLTSNGFDINVGTDNAPNWNNGTVEFDHTNNEWMMATLDPDPSNNVGALFVYAQLGSADVFGRFIGAGNINDSNTADTVAWLVSATTNLATMEGGSQELQYPLASLSGFNLISIIVSDTGYTMRINGTEVDSSAKTGTVASFELLSFGRAWTNSYGASLNLRVAALVEGEMTLDSIEKIEGWIMQEVGDKDSLPVGHSYKNVTYSDGELVWNPQELGTSVVTGMWVPYAYPDSLTLSGTDVTQIDDLSGNGFDMTVAAVGNSPNWNSATNEVEFDSTNSEGLTASLLGDSTAYDAHLFYAFKPLVSTLHDQWFTRANSSRGDVGDSGLAWAVGDGSIRIWNGNVALITSSNITTTIIGQSKVSSTTGASLRIDGVEVGSSATNSQARMDKLCIATDDATDFTSMNLRGVVYIKGELSYDNMTKIEGWLAYKCGLQENLPANHPYRFTTFTDPVPSFSPATYDIAWEWKADQSDWTTYTPGGGGNYFISAPNLNAAHTGSSNGNEIYSNTGTGGADTGKGWTIEDADKGIKLTSVSEESIKTRLWDGSSETGLRNDIGHYFELCVVTFTNGYGPSNNFRKDNGWVSSKWEGGSRWKHEDIFAENADGTGGNFNGDITMPFNGTVDGNSSKTYLFAHTRDMGNAAAQVHACINANVPGTYADGPKYVQWIQEVTAEGSWSPLVNDSLNESIEQVIKSYTYSPAYVHATAPDTDNTSANTHEYYWQEGTILHMFIYGKKVITTQELSDAYEYAKNFL